MPGKVYGMRKENKYALKQGVFCTQIAYKWSTQFLSAGTSLDEEMVSIEQWIGPKLKNFLLSYLGI